MDEMRWHTDGHIMSLMLDKDRIVVAAEPCPHKGDEDASCYHRTAGCIVAHFINAYGLELNVGRTPARPQMEISWALAGDRYDLDACQVWMLPVEDEAFSSFLASYSADT